MVMRELRGSLFAVEGSVDAYFNAKQCNERFEDERGQVFLCEKPLAHTGAHESGDWEWWDEANITKTIESIRNGEPIKPVRIDTHNWPTPVVAMFRLWLLREDVERHIREGPQREAAALRKANWRNELDSR
jgi:hypothetical protein